ncbi:MAG: hypothetical protein AMS18_14495 [Gemmatimonas sp. SG8_17]|nr:MAG: hypothetical protein AMS18_14495 [Gemmatimonas sp. SG8_17]
MRMGIPSDWLQGSLFADYVVPGLILLLVLDVFPLPWCTACGLGIRGRGAPLFWWMYPTPVNAGSLCMAVAH